GSRIALVSWAPSRTGSTPHTEGTREPGRRALPGAPPVTYPRMEASGRSSLQVGDADGVGTETRPEAPDQLKSTDQGAAPPPAPRLGLLLAVCCVAQFMVILDLSIVNVALPSIQSSLNFSSAELQWVVDAYAIAFAGFLMLGGRTADRLGQRRVFVTALLVFALTSLVGGASVNREMLIIARGVQGLSCAFMAASS